MDQFLHSVVCEDGGIVEELRVGDLSSVNKETVRHEWVPVVQLVKLHRDAILVLELCVEEQGWIELQLQVVAAQVLHVVFDHDPNSFTWQNIKKSII